MRELLRRLRAHDRAPELRAALGARRGGLRRLAPAAASSASATPAPTRSTTSSRAPAPTRASSASRSSMGLNRAVQRADRGDGHHRSADARGSTSRCPAARTAAASTTSATSGSTAPRSRSGEHTIPAYVAHIGGNYEGGEIVYGTRLKVRLAAKRVPEAVERWIRKYEAEREDGEGFNAFAARVGTREFEDAVRDLAMPVEFGLETMNQFIDWTEGAVPGHPRRGRVRGLMLDHLRPARSRGHPRHPRGGGRAREARCCCSPAARTRSSCCTSRARRSGRATSRSG